MSEEHSQSKHETLLHFYNSAAQFSVTSLVAVAVVQFSILLLLEGKVNAMDVASLVLLYPSMLIAYVAVIILGAYLIYNYILFAHLIEYVRGLPALREIDRIDFWARKQVRECACLAGVRRSILTTYWSKRVFPFLYAVISVWLLFSI